MRFHENTLVTIVTLHDHHMTAQKSHDSYLLIKFPKLFKSSELFFITKSAQLKAES